MPESDIEVVNIAALGNLQREIAIQEVAKDAPLPVTNYDPEFNATFFRFAEDGELIIMYESGKYILRGGDEFDRMYEINEMFLEMLSDLGISVENPTLEIKNVVSVGNLERELDLNALTVELGFEEVEYEPEQFPGLVYRPEETRAVLLVFGSGKLVITGGRTIEDDVEAFELLQNRIERSSL